MRMSRVGRADEAGAARRSAWCLAALVAAVAPSARADDSMYCDGRLIVRGMPAIEVLRACGQPDQVQTSQAERFTSLAGPTVPRSPNLQVGRSRIVQIEQWYYSAHSDRLSRILDLEDGRLLDIKVGTVP